MKILIFQIFYGNITNLKYGGVEKSNFDLQEQYWKLAISVEVRFSQLDMKLSTCTVKTAAGENLAAMLALVVARSSPITNAVALMAGISCTLKPSILPSIALTSEPGAAPNRT